jgi:hypothetical protein
MPGESPSFALVRSDSRVPPTIAIVYATAAQLVRPGRGRAPNAICRPCRLITVCPPELRFVGTVTTPPQRPDVSLGLALLQEAHPVLAGVIDEHPAFDPKAWTLPRRSAGPRRPRRPRAGDAARARTVPSKGKYRARPREALRRRAVIRGGATQAPRSDWLMLARCNRRVTGRIAQRSRAPVGSGKLTAT